MAALKNPVELPEDQESPAMRFARLPTEEREARLAALSPEEQEALLWDWAFWARPKQLEPLVCDNPPCGLDPCPHARTSAGRKHCGCGGDWRTWLALAGRGFGKTRLGAEWVRRNIERQTYRRINVVGATASDTRDIIVEGPSGILSVCPPSLGAQYSPTKRRISFSSGAVVMCFSADEPDRLRGHQCDAAWADELAAWRYDQEAWTQLMLGLRLGNRPRVVVTTTPRPTRIIKDLVRRDSTHVTTGSTFENWDNLAATFTEEIVAQYEGTRIGRQEIYAMILDEAPGALWNQNMFSEPGFRVLEKDLPIMKRVVVAIDPSVKFDAEDGDETGIVVVGEGDNGDGYVLEDLSGRMKPDEWSRAAVTAYYRWGADRIVAETNQGGDMVEHTLRVVDPDISFRSVTASRGKVTRAEPVAALYEKRRIHHAGFFDLLEDQCCNWSAGDPESPDRMDALVWGLSYLFVGGKSITWKRWGQTPELKGESYWRKA